MHYSSYTILSAFALILSPTVHAAWTVSGLHCHDSDCFAGSITFGFDFDNGAGIKAGCGGTYSVWAPPSGLQNCDNPAVKWEFVHGVRFGGCTAFPLRITLDEAQQEKTIQINEGLDPNYSCTQLVSPPCGGTACQNCQNTNCQPLTTVFEPDSTANNAAGFRPGWCGLHVTQYQKPDPSKDHYKFDITIKDANGAEIGGVKGADATNPVGVTSKLPWVLIVTAGMVDADPVLFAYADQNWGSNDQQHHCNFGAYDSGNRDGDCGFTC